MADQALSRDPQVLYRASLEHMVAADVLLEADLLPLALYAAGLSVECILQAVALRRDPHMEHDARHDLDLWLRKCPMKLQNALKSPPVREDWNELRAFWSNSIRYLSHEGLLSAMRKREAMRRLRGDEKARLKTLIHRVVASAHAVHLKGVGAWNSKNA